MCNFPGFLGSAIGIYEFLSSRLTKDEKVIKKQIRRHVESICYEVNREHNESGKTEDYVEIITNPMIKVINKAVIGLFDRKEHISKKSIRAELEKEPHDIPEHIKEQLLEQLELGLGISFEFCQLNFDAWLERSFDEVKFIMYEIRDVVSKTHDNTLDIIAMVEEILKRMSPANPATSPPASAFNLPTKNPNFKGRKEALGKISTALETQNKFALTGPGGFGKTQIAVKYAYDNLHRYKHVWLVNADSVSLIEQSYRNFAQRIGEAGASDMKSDEILHFIQRWFASNDGWLFIYDNAEGVGGQDLNKYLPQDGLKGHIIICTRDTKYGHGVVDKYEVGVFTQREATDFLGNALAKGGVHITDKEAEDISHRLGRLPLALNLAVLYLYNNSTTTSCSQYIQLLKEHGMELLDDHKSMDYDETITATWKISMDKIQSEAAKQLFNLCAYCAPDHIPLAMFIDGREYLPSPLKEELEPDNVRGRNKLLGELSKYGLVSLDVIETAVKGDGSEHGFLSIHRLIQENVRGIHGDDGRWLLCCLDITHNTFAYNFGDVLSMTRFKHNVPHAGQIADYVVELFGEDDELQVKAGWVYNRAGFGLTHEGDYPKALEWYYKALAIAEKVLGLEHPHTATTYNNIAGVYNNQGDYPKALEWYYKGLAIYEKVLGLEHSSTATAYNNIAGVYHDQGDYPKALEWYNKALVVDEKVLGLEHPSTATTYNNIAAVYNNQGDYPKALEWYYKALAIAEKVLGLEHPHTATTYNNIALACNNQGDYPKVLEWYYKALTIREKVLGLEHPHTAATYNNIAGVYKNQGDYPKALEWYYKALAIAEKVLGLEHPHTAATYNNIAGVYDNQGDYPKALELYLKSYTINLVKLGIIHPNTQITKRNMELTYSETNPNRPFEEWLLEQDCT